MNEKKNRNETNTKREAHDCLIGSNNNDNCQHHPTKYVEPKLIWEANKAVKRTLIHSQWFCVQRKNEMEGQIRREGGRKAAWKILIWYGLCATSKMVRTAHIQRGNLQKPKQCAHSKVTVERTLILAACWQPSLWCVCVVQLKIVIIVIEYDCRSRCIHNDRNFFSFPIDELSGRWNVFERSSLLHQS